MIGAIAGDIIGSVYEWNPIKTTEFPLFGNGCHFTDDSVLTIALADYILHGGEWTEVLKTYANRYPDAGYGANFYAWMRSRESKPYNSWGNGSAMRVSAVGFAFPTIDKVLEEAEKSAIVTHDHPEGVKGAQATAAAIFLARQKKTKPEVKAYIESQFGYELDEPIDSIREWYEFDVSCQGTMPPAIRAFYEAENFEQAIRLAVSLGGDSDTLACITGGIAQAYYGIPDDIRNKCLTYLDEHLLSVVQEFCTRFHC